MKHSVKNTEWFFITVLNIKISSAFETNFKNA